MVSEKDFWKPSERKMENGLCLTETEDSASTEELDYKHTDTIRSIFQERETTFSTLII